MSYCNKCGKELKDNQKFCDGCGKQVGGGNENKPFQFKKIILIVISVFVLLIIFLFIFSDNRDTNVGNVIDDFSDKEKEDCPYECCVDAEYKTKQCILDYECMNNKCIAIDSDNDGLSDMEEKNIGTNPELYDTDGDTLSDYHEHITLGTNPLNRNTDEDRYDDNEDNEPLIKNSANVKVEILKNEKSWNEELKKKLLPVLGCLVIYGVESSFGEVTGIIASACSYLTTGTSIAILIKEDISYRDIEIQVKNVGDDYTSYVKYKMNVYIKYENKPAELFDSKEVNLDLLNSGGIYIDEINYSFKIEDYTIKVLKNILEGKTGDKEYIFEFENLEYEKF